MLASFNNMYGRNSNDKKYYDQSKKLADLQKKNTQVDMALRGYPMYGRCESSSLQKEQSIVEWQKRKLEQEIARNNMKK